MHKEGVSHRDIKPDNILIDKNYTLKIVDFGLSAWINSNKKMDTEIGTLPYMAPEIYTGSYVGSEVDIFATGVILFILISNHGPFQTTKETDLTYLYFKTNKNDYWNSKNKDKVFSFDLINLLDRMLD